MKIETVLIQNTETERKMLIERTKELEAANKAIILRAEAAEKDWQLAEERIKDIEAQLEQHRWIPISERLPEEEQKNSVMSKEVFVSDGREVWKARCVVSGKRWSYTNSPSATLPITHWKPIILP